MKQLIFLIIFLILSCVGYAQKSTKKSSSVDVKEPIKIITFKSCFGTLDTVQAAKENSPFTGKVTSCSWGTYKIIDKKYILRIDPQYFDVKLNKCYDIKIDSVDLSDLVELLVYDSLDATISNICVDVGDLNNPHPSRKLKPQSGHLYIGFTSLIKSLHHPEISILVKYLIFNDPIEKKEIKLTSELIWKSHYQGIPG